MALFKTPDDLPASTDAELFVALGSGRTDALGILYDRYGSLVYGLTRTILGNAQEAEDLTQEIFLSLCRNPAYDPNRGTVGTYLITLSRSRSLDRLRARKRNLKYLRRWGQSTAAEPLPATPLEKASITECAETVRKALAELTPEQRQAIELSYFKGLSQSEIASYLNTPLGTVKSWMRRGLSELKLTLRDFVG
jgi:RNA polymerase sigma-70 factor, ECF subfamily